MGMGMDTNRMPLAPAQPPPPPPPAAARGHAREGSQACSPHAREGSQACSPHAREGSQAYCHTRARVHKRARHTRARPHSQSLWHGVSSSPPPHLPPPRSARGRRYSERSGTYSLHVTIGSVDVSGSPTKLHMGAARPDVDKFEISGAGLGAAVAGVSSVVSIRCKDQFGNVCLLACTGVRFGLAMVSTDTRAGKGGGEGEGEGEVARKKKDGGGKGRETRSEMSAAGRERSQLAAFEAITASIPFEGTWAEEVHTIAYTAELAGEFDLHVWYVAGESTTRERLPGSPFTLKVSEGGASAAGSFVKNAAQVHGQSLPSGQEIVLGAQLRDQFGNASTAVDGALTGLLEVRALYERYMRERARATHPHLQPRTRTHMQHVRTVTRLRIPTCVRNPRRAPVHPTHDVPPCTQHTTCPPRAHTTHDVPPPPRAHRLVCLGGRTGARQHDRPRGQASAWYWRGGVRGAMRATRVRRIPDAHTPERPANQRMPRPLPHRRRPPQRRQVEAHAADGAAIHR